MRASGSLPAAGSPGQGVERILPAYPLLTGRLQEQRDLQGTLRPVREPGKGVGFKSPTHFLHGHAAVLVWRNPVLPKLRRPGSRPGTVANRHRETYRV